MKQFLKYGNMPLLSLWQKSKSPKVLNDFRPVALTSLVMKNFEELVKQEILKQVEG